MNNNITPVERKHFDAIYEHMAKNFPKDCSNCGRHFENELEYSLNTAVLGEPADHRDIDMGFLFYRNHIYRGDERRNVPDTPVNKYRELQGEDCPPIDKASMCGTTMAFNPVISTDFIDYIEARATIENKSPSEVMSEVRDDYNSYLIEKIESH